MREKAIASFRLLWPRIMPGSGYARGSGIVGQIAVGSDLIGVNEIIQDVAGAGVVAAGVGVVGIPQTVPQVDILISYFRRSQYPP